MRVSTEIAKLQAGSNFEFTKEYKYLGLICVLGISDDIVKNRRPKCSLESLFKEAFGMAAIYYFNGGKEIAERRFNNE